MAYEETRDIVLSRVGLDCWEVLVSRIPSQMTRGTVILHFGSLQIPLACCSAEKLIGELAKNVAMLGQESMKK